MDRKTYIDTVLSTLRRVTGDEKLAIRAELDGHIEDHMEGLLELGYDEALAEERTLAAMGDPKEVGRELNRQYTGWGWVLLSRAAVLLTAVLCIQALLGLGVSFFALSNTTIIRFGFPLRSSREILLWLQKSISRFSKASIPVRSSIT